MDIVRPVEAMDPGSCREHLDTIPRDRGFGNASLIRNIFEAVVAQHASRIVTVSDPADDDLSRLTDADIRTAV